MIRRSLLLFTLALWALASSAYAAGASHPPVCIVLISGTSLADWTAPSSPPTLRQILLEGSVAVMNVRTARNPQEDEGAWPSAAALTLSSDARCASTNPIKLYATSQPAPFGTATCGQILQRRTGVVAPAGALVDIDWPRLLYENSDLGYRADIGNLISTLRSQGIAAYASGGPDAFTAGLGDGYVLPGDPSTALSLNDALWIVDLTGSFDRSEMQLAALRSRVSKAGGLLIVASLYTDATDYRAGRRLTPVVFDGPGFPAGSLYSPSTHTTGLVILPDLTASIARQEGLSLPVTYGEPLLSHPIGGISTAAALERLADRQRAAMALLPPFAVVLGLWLTAVAALSKNRKITGALALYPPMAILWLVLLPGVLQAVAAGAVCSVLLLLYDRREYPRITIIVTCLAPMLAILSDPMHGSMLMHTGMIGYSVIEGARYYGIGNEAMGVVIGSALAFAYWYACSKAGNKAFGLFFLLALIVCLLGLPQAGAKVGGVLVGVGAFGAFLTVFRTGKLNAARLTLLAAAVLVALAVFISLDAISSSGHETHLGRLWSSTISGGSGDFLDTVRRKLEVEARLLYHSCWAVALYGGLAAFFATMPRGRDAASSAYRTGAIAAIVLTLLLNDAGVAACALMIPFLVLANKLGRMERPRPDEATARSPEGAPSR